MGTHSFLFLLPSLFFFFLSSFFFFFILPSLLSPSCPHFTTTHLQFILPHILLLPPTQLFILWCLTFSFDTLLQFGRFPQPTSSPLFTLPTHLSHHLHILSLPVRCPSFSSSLTFPRHLDNQKPLRFHFIHYRCTLTFPNPIAIQPKAGPRPNITRGRSISIDLLFFLSRKKEHIMHLSSSGEGKKGGITQTGTTCNETGRTMGRRHH